MAGERHGTASWPGVGGTVESCSYTCSHGITPGAATLVCHLPPGVLPAMRGTLVISDGVGAISLRDCKVEDCTARVGGDGQTHTLLIRDRRWMWGAGRIDGCYNQLDPFGRLIPWTIRSPKELALLCLQAMGEGSYNIDALPPGLTNPGAAVVRTLITPSGLNPPINWFGIPPAQALQQVAESFGCRVVFDPVTDSVIVARVGQGRDLPGGSLYTRSPSLKSPDAPAAVCVVGGPTLFQCRLALEPVGLEWDGTYVPIDLLSYAPPLVQGRKQAWEVTVTYGEVDLAAKFEVFAGAVKGEDPRSGVSLSYGPGGGDDADDIALALANLVNASADPRVSGRMTATASANVVTIRGRQDGYEFSVAAEMGDSFDPANGIAAVMTQRAVRPGKRRWENTDPGNCYDAVATDRLTQNQAQQLASQSVFKLYRLKTEGPAGGPMVVAGYTGKIVRREQIVLTGERVEQIVPEDIDPSVKVNNSQAFDAYVANLYAGLSKSKAAAVYGSVSVECISPTGLWYTEALENTDAASQVHIPFGVTPQWQLISFSIPVYRRGLYAIEYPELLLETGVMVRDAVTNQLSAYSRTEALPGGNPGGGVKVEVHDDIQLNVVADYDGSVPYSLVGTRIYDADALVRADYYLRGLASRFSLGRGEMRGYNGIVPVPLDGAVMQAEYSVGAQGAETTASRNFEFSPFVPSYPARRRAEYLPPAADGGPQMVEMAEGRRGRLVGPPRPAG